MNLNDEFVIRKLVDNLLEKLKGLTLVQEETTTIIQVSSTSEPIGHKKTTKYYIEVKKWK